MEFLVEIEVRLTPDITPKEKARLVAAERVRGNELTTQGVLRAIWRVPGRFANRAIWSATDATQLHQFISCLPLWPYLDVKVTPRAEHDIAEHCLGLPPG